MLETYPKEEFIRLGSTVIWFDGLLSPVIFNIKYTMDCDKDTSYLISSNVVERYKNKIWKINGFSEYSQIDYNSLSPAKVLFFKTNSIGSLMETVAQEIKIVVYNELLAKGITVYDMNFSCIPITPENDSILISLDGNTQFVKMNYTLPKNYNPHCDDCKKGLELLQLSMSHINKKFIIWRSNDVKFNRDLNLSFSSRDGDNDLDSLTKSFAFDNAGALEMSRIENFCFVRN